LGPQRIDTQGNAVPASRRRARLAIANRRS
jgi:hypothetical protein